jgi:hypothetical protein
LSQKPPESQPGISCTDAHHALCHVDVLLGAAPDTQVRLTYNVDAGQTGQLGLQAPTSLHDDRDFATPDGFGSSWSRRRDRRASAISRQAAASLNLTPLRIIEEPDSQTCANDCHQHGRDERSECPDQHLAQACVR